MIRSFLHHTPYQLSLSHAPMASEYLFWSLLLQHLKNWWYHGNDAGRPTISVPLDSTGLSSPSLLESPWWIQEFLRLLRGPTPGMISATADEDEIFLNIYIPHSLEQTLFTPAVADGQLHPLLQFDRARPVPIVPSRTIPVNISSEPIPTDPQGIDDGTTCASLPDLQSLHAQRPQQFGPWFGKLAEYAYADEAQRPLEATFEYHDSQQLQPYFKSLLTLVLLLSFLVSLVRLCTLFCRRHPTSRRRKARSATLSTPTPGDQQLGSKNDQRVSGTNGEDSWSYGDTVRPFGPGSKLVFNGVLHDIFDNPAATKPESIERKSPKDTTGKSSSDFWKGSFNVAVLRKILSVYRERVRGMTDALRLGAGPLPTDEASKLKDLLLQGKTEQLALKDQLLAQKNKELQTQYQRLQEKDDEMASMDQLLQDKVEMVATKDEILQSKEEQLNLTNQILQDRDKQLTSMAQSLQDKDDQLKITSLSLQEKEEELKSTELTSKNKDDQLKATSLSLENKDEELNSSKLAWQSKDDLLKSTTLLLEKQKEELVSKNSKITELEAKIEQQAEQIAGHHGSSNLEHDQLEESLQKAQDTIKEQARETSHLSSKNEQLQEQLRKMKSTAAATTMILWECWRRARASIKPLEESKQFLEKQASSAVAAVGRAVREKDKVIDRQRKEIQHLRDAQQDVLILKNQLIEKQKAELKGKDKVIKELLAGQKETVQGKDKIMNEQTSELEKVATAQKAIIQAKDKIINKQKSDLERLAADQKAVVEHKNRIIDEQKAELQEAIADQNTVVQDRNKIIQEQKAELQEVIAGQKVLVQDKDRIIEEQKAELQEIIAGQKAAAQGKDKVIDEQKSVLQKVITTHQAIGRDKDKIINEQKGELQKVVASQKAIVRSKDMTIGEQRLELERLDLKVVEQQSIIDGLRAERAHAIQAATPLLSSQKTPKMEPAAATPETEQGFSQTCSPFKFGGEPTIPTRSLSIVSPKPPQSPTPKQEKHDTGHIFTMPKVKNEGHGPGQLLESRFARQGSEVRQSSRAEEKPPQPADDKPKAHKSLAPKEKNLGHGPGPLQESRHARGRVEDKQPSWMEGPLMPHIFTVPKVKNEGHGPGQLLESRFAPKPSVKAASTAEEKPKDQKDKPSSRKEEELMPHIFTMPKVKNEGHGPGQLLESRHARKQSDGPGARQPLHDRVTRGRKQHEASPPVSPHPGSPHSQRGIRYGSPPRNAEGIPTRPLTAAERAVKAAAEAEASSPTASHTTEGSTPATPTPGTPAASSTTELGSSKQPPPSSITVALPAAAPATPKVQGGKKPVTPSTAEGTPATASTPTPTATPRTAAAGNKALKESKWAS